MKKNLYVLYAMALLQGMVFYGPITTLYRQAQGVTVFEITVIESISLALCILLEIPWGMIADKIGYRKTMIFCSFLYFISKIVFWQATGFGGFLAERIMLSVVLAGYSGVDSSILYLSCEGTDRQKAFGLYSSMSMAGLLIAAAVFSAFVGDDYRLAGLLTVISYGLAMVLTFGLTEVRQSNAAEPAAEPFRESLRQIVSNRTLLLFLVGAALLSETHQTITVFLNQLQIADQLLTRELPPPPVPGCADLPALEQLLRWMVLSVLEHAKIFGDPLLVSVLTDKKDENTRRVQLLEAQLTGLLKDLRGRELIQSRCTDRQLEDLARILMAAHIGWQQQMRLELWDLSRAVELLMQAQWTVIRPFLSPAGCLQLDALPR